MRDGDDSDDYEEGCINDGGIDGGADGDGPAHSWISWVGGLFYSSGELVAP